MNLTARRGNGCTSRAAGPRGGRGSNWGRESTYANPMKWIILILAFAANVIAAAVIRADYHSAPMDLTKPLPAYVEPLWEHPRPMVPLAVAAALTAACFTMFIRSGGRLWKLGPPMVNVLALILCICLVLDHPRWYRLWYQKHNTVMLNNLRLPDS